MICATSSSPPWAARRRRSRCRTKAQQQPAPVFGFLGGESPDLFVEGLAVTFCDIFRRADSAERMTATEAAHCSCHRMTAPGRFFASIALFSTA
jgi:hypothetical protein